MECNFCREGILKKSISKYNKMVICEICKVAETFVIWEMSLYKSTVEQDSISLGSWIRKIERMKMGNRMV